MKSVLPILLVLLSYRSAHAELERGQYDVSVGRKAENVYQDSRTGLVIITEFCSEQTPFREEEAAVLKWEGTYSNQLIFLGDRGEERATCRVKTALSATSKDEGRVLKRRFKTAFRAWVALDEHFYNLDVPPDGRPSIPLTRALVSDGWRCGVLPEKRIPRSTPMPEKKEQIFRCERDNTAAGTVYAARVEARATCIVGEWDSDQQVVVLANKTQVEKKAPSKRGETAVITKTTSVSVLLGIGCSTIDLNESGAKVLQGRLFPDAPNL